MGQGLGFQQLRKILLEQDWEERKELAQKLQQLDGQLNTREELEQRISPILEDQEARIQREFPVLFGPQITESIKKQIKESQDEVVEVLYPIIGRMIKKYITNEIQKLSDKVDAQMELAFSWEGWKLRIRAWISGTPQKDLMLSKLIEPRIDEIHVIEKNSGLLLGSYSKKENLDRDMVAGMLTAIKSFVEDAFQGDTQELESIDYQNYKIIIKSFQSFFIAVVCTGKLNTSFKDKLDDELLNFAQRVLEKARKAGKEELEQELINEGLEEYFQDFEELNE
ncbi:hypothetical protein [Roseivirga sp.]|uniref:hypothetical protein n=1 Tax=Roseivirga sp. TaxID=1964215 RepID=UPI003B526952